MGSVLAADWQGNAPDEAWAAPTASAIKSVGQVSGLGQTEDLHHINYDCTPETFRYEFEPFGSMHTGCFASTAFGAFDIDNFAVRGFGFSGAIPLKTFGNQSPLPIPHSAEMATTSAASPMGSYLHIYTYLPSGVQVQYDWQLQPYLQLPQSANVVLSDPSGEPIIINAQTVAYSDNGSWMVVESPWRSFFRVNMATFDIVPFAPSFTTQAFDYAEHESQVAITDDGRYVAVQSNEFKSFKVYDLATCTGTATAKLDPLACQSHDYQPYVSGQIASLGRIQRVRFVNDGLISFHAQHSADNDVYELAPTDKITNLLDYLALGDSYSAGEGAFNYVVGTDTANDLCHQSTNSYPYLLAKDAFTVPGSHSVACSGAVTGDITNTSAEYTGQVKDKVFRRDRININNLLSDFTPGYLAQHEFVQKYQPRIVTVGVGGNDIGFADILKACVMPHAGNNTCYNTYEDRKELADTIDHTYDKWVALYKQLQSEAPDTAIYAIGYPQIAAANGNCGVNVHLNNDEVVFSNYLIDYLNSVIHKAATDAGITYVDISHALDGHRLCEASSASVAVNGLTAGNDVHHILGNESYHPNAFGQELIEQAILRQTHNFSATPEQASGSLATIPAIAPSDPLLNVPKTNRAVHTTIPATISDNEIIPSNGTVTVHLDGTQGPQPNKTYTVTLSGSGASIGTITSDDRGNINGTLPIPDAVSSGAGVLDISGPSLTGQPVDFTQTVYVTTSPTDTDGDGILDTDDVCPTMPNSGQDTDRDGIDDVCDAFIGLSASNSTAGTPPTGTADNSVQVAASPENKPSDRTALITSATTRTSQTSAIPRTTGVVLGTATAANAPTVPLGQISGRLVYARDNLPMVYWIPWAVDAGLVLLLVMFLSILFGRLADRR